MRTDGFTSFETTTLERLTAIVGETGISVQETDRLAYARDMYVPGTISIRSGQLLKIPDFVVWPNNEEQIQQLLAASRELQVPVIPYGCGSGVCGGALPLSGGIVIDLKRMSGIVEIDRESLTVTAQTGIIGEHLERQLNARGYTMGHFPSSIYCSTLGGYLATRSAGQSSARYGKIEDMAVRLRVVTPDSVVHEIEVGARGIPGLDLSALFLGSEGTLGMITQAVMRVHPYPETRRFRAFMFPGTEQGLTALRTIMQHGLRPAAARLYDEFDTMLAGTTGKGESTFAGMPLAELSNWLKPLSKQAYQSAEAFLLGHPEWLTRFERFLPQRCLLILTFEGSCAGTLTEERAAARLCDRAGGVDAGSGPAEKWWQNRYHVSYLASKVYESGSFVDTMEVAASWDKIEPLYRDLRRALSPLVFVMAHFSHAYRSGCSIYFTVVGHRSTPEKSLELHAKAWEEAMAVFIRHGATISHHHGIGILKKPWLPDEFGLGIEIFHLCKETIDSVHLCNRGKLGI